VLEPTFRVPARLSVRWNCLDDESVLEAFCINSGDVRLMKEPVGVQGLGQTVPLYITEQSQQHVVT
jgi:hypothetical protein